MGTPTTNSLFGCLILLQAHWSLASSANDDEARNYGSYARPLLHAVIACSALYILSKFTYYVFTIRKSKQLAAMGGPAEEAPYYAYAKFKKSYDSPYELEPMTREGNPYDDPSAIKVSPPGEKQAKKNPYDSPYELELVTTKGKGKGKGKGKQEKDGDGCEKPSTSASGKGGEKDGDGYMRPSSSASGKGGEKDGDGDGDWDEGMVPSTSASGKEEVKDGDGYMRPSTSPKV